MSWHTFAPAQHVPLLAAILVGRVWETGIVTGLVISFTIISGTFETRATNDDILWIQRPPAGLQ